MNDPRDLFTPNGQKAASNVQVVLSCDGGALKLQAQCIANIHTGDELLFSYGDLFWGKDKAANRKNAAASISAGKAPASAGSKAAAYAGQREIVCEIGAKRKRGDN
jgi:SET domain-containing protein